MQCRLVWPCLSRGLLGERESDLLPGKCLADEPEPLLGSHSLRKKPRQGTGCSGPPRPPEGMQVSASLMFAGGAQGVCLWPQQVLPQECFTVRAPCPRDEWLGHTEPKPQDLSLRAASAPRFPPGEMS